MNLFNRTAARPAGEQGRRHGVMSGGGGGKGRVIVDSVANLHPRYPKNWKI